MNKQYKNGNGMKRSARDLNFIYYFLEKPKTIYRELGALRYELYSIKIEFCFVYSISSMQNF